MRQVESALVAHKRVAEAAVVGYNHPIKGQGIWAYVTLLEVRSAAERQRIPPWPACSPADNEHWRAGTPPGLGSEGWREAAARPWPRVCGWLSIWRKKPAHGG